MIRLKKIQQPRMVSSRIEQADFDKFVTAMQTQSYLTLQDFIVYAFKLFNEGYIVIDNKDFALRSSPEPELEPELVSELEPEEINDPE